MTELSLDPATLEILKERHLAFLAARLGSDAVTRLTIVPTMLTPGGVHSEEEIPEVIEAMRAELPALEIVYAWPFDLDAVAGLLAAAANASTT
jgi:sirohydrochlorin cobaltochelatase